jgi:Na+-translocating ferredoxin:NAD+ oxidoreductase RnfE subunit
MIDRIDSLLIALGTILSIVVLGFVLALIGNTMDKDDE